MEFKETKAIKATKELKRLKMTKQNQRKRLKKLKRLEELKELKMKNIDKARQVVQESGVSLQLAAQLLRENHYNVQNTILTAKCMKGNEDKARQVVERTGVSLQLAKHLLKTNHYDVENTITVAQHMRWNKDAEGHKLSPSNTNKVINCPSSNEPINKVTAIHRKMPNHADVVEVHKLINPQQTPNLIIPTKHRIEDLRRELTVIVEDLGGCGKAAKQVAIKAYGYGPDRSTIAKMLRHEGSETTLAMTLRILNIQ